MENWPGHYDRRIGVRRFTPPIPAVVRCTGARESHHRHVVVTRDVPATVLEASVTGVRVSLDANEEPPPIGSPVRLRLSDAGEASGVLRRHVDFPPDTYAIEIVEANEEFHAALEAHLDDDRGDLGLVWRLAR